MYKLYSWEWFPLFGFIPVPYKHWGDSNFLTKAEAQIDADYLNKVYGRKKFRVTKYV